MLPTGDHFRAKVTYALEVRRQKKTFHANGNEKKVGVAILISDKIDFKTKAIKKDKAGHYIMIKPSTEGVDIILVNIYAPNIEAHKYIKIQQT